MKFQTFLASEHVTLDSHVKNGGGTDVTEGLQKILDMAGDDKGIRLIMDGAALISTLELSSNTIIECLSLDCGFYQMDNANRPIVTNKIWDMRERATRNITLTGGTYNQNCRHQEHHIPAWKDLILPTGEGPSCDGMANRVQWIYGMAFYGVENLVIRDLHLQDFRTFGIMVGGFRHVTIENVWLDLPGHMDAQNQDGFHFWGPGEFLTMRNIGGRVGDDFMNIGPDEGDGVSSITDVLVDGVFLEHADQAIRMLSYGTGRLDRVTVRNVSGTYRSFGFYINCWFPGKTYGDFGNILIENVDLRQEAPNYHYREPMLFSVGGNIESLTMQNIRHHMPTDKRTLFELGIPFHAINWDFPAENLPKMKNIFIKDLTVIEEGTAAAGCEYVQVYLPIDNLVLRDVYILREDAPADSTLLSFRNTGSIERLVMQNVLTTGVKKLVDEEEKVGKIISSQVVKE